MNLKGKIIDKNTNECTEFQTKAIYKKDKIKYFYENDTYILNIISPKKLILKRITPEIESTIYFEENKNTLSIYLVKEQGISFKIEIKTKMIKISKNKIIIL